MWDKVWQRIVFSKKKKTTKNICLSNSKSNFLELEIKIHLLFSFFLIWLRQAGFDIVLNELNPSSRQVCKFLSYIKVIYFAS